MEKINERNEPANNFELHCQQSSEKNACWNLFCTCLSWLSFRNICDHERRSVPGQWTMAFSMQKLWRSVVQMESIQRRLPCPVSSYRTSIPSKNIAKLQISRLARLPGNLLILVWNLGKRGKTPISNLGSSTPWALRRKGHFARKHSSFQNQNRTGPLYYYDLEYFEEPFPVKILESIGETPIFFRDRIP